MNEAPPIMETPPSNSNRRGWAIHLGLMTAYLVILTMLGLGRTKTQTPALSHSTSGLLIVCSIELAVFGTIFGLAWLASRASVDDLLLHWRGKILPVLFGAGYSIALRILIGVVFAAAAAILVLTHVLTPAGLQDFAMRNRPDVETAVDVVALRNNPVYFWLTITVVSFVLAGIREELWRSAFLAGLRKLWPRYFASDIGQVWAVLVAAIIFGAAHLSMGILAAVMAGILGVGLGLIMVFHRSIWPAVLAHGFFDATSMALIPWVMEFMHHLPKG